MRRFFGTLGEIVRAATIPPEPVYWRQATQWRVLVGLAAVAMAILCFLFGGLVFLHGAFASANWFGPQGGETDAFVGLIFVVLGALVAHLVRYVVCRGIEAGPRAPGLPAHREGLAVTDPLVGAFPLGSKRGEEEILYVASTSSNIFHRPSCRHAQKISRSHRRVFSSHERALQLGLRACSACRP